MKKPFTKLWAITLLLFFGVLQVNAQSAASATYSFSTDLSGSVSGNVTAATASMGSGLVGTAFSTIVGTVGNWGVVGLTTTPIVYSATSYVEFDITPSTSYNLNINSVIANLFGNGSGNGKVAAYYSLNGFTSSTALGNATYNSSSVAATSGTPISLLNTSAATASAQGATTFSPSIAVSAGQTISIRFYMWCTTASKSITIKNVVISGTAGINPTIYSVSGTTVISRGSSSDITLSNSQTGVTYQLFNGAVASGSPVPGTGSALTWTVSPTSTSTYTVKTVTGDATYWPTSMTGSAVITVNQPNPDIALTSAAGTDSQSRTFNNAITDITYTIANGTATTAALTWSGTADANTPPTGITVNFTTPILTITGTPSIVGTYGYTATTDGTPAATATGTITAVKYLTGDYVSQATGTWATLSTWKSWSGSSWNTAPSTAPGTSNTVWIEGGYTVTVAAAGVCKDLHVISGKLLNGNPCNGTYTPLGTIGVSGTTFEVTTGGTIGNGLDDDSADAISFTLNNAGTTTVTGIGGVINASKFNFGSTNAGAAMVIDHDINVHYHGTAFAGSAFGMIANANNQTLTINPGKTVTLAKWCSLGNTGTGNSTPSANFTVNVNGTLTLQAGRPTGNAQTYSWANSGTSGNGYLVCNAGASNVFTLTIGSTGTVNVPEFYPNGTTALGTAGIGSVSTITIASGGSLNVGVLADLRNATQTITGAGAFNLLSGSIMRIGNVAGITFTDPTGPIQTTTRSFDSNATYQYEGTAAQVTGNGLPSIVNNLLINNATGVTLSSATTVNGTLTLTAGALSNSSNPLTLGNTTTINTTAGTLSTVPTFGTSVNLNYNGLSVKGNEFPISDIINTLTVNNTAGIALNDNRNIPNLNIASSSSLTVNAGKQLTVNTTMSNGGTLNLLSDGTNGTATILTPATISGSGTSKVQQYLTIGRNLYISSPVTGALRSVIMNATNVNSYVEGSETWFLESAANTLTPLKGYVATVDGTSGAVTFSGTLNNGPVSNTSLGATSTGIYTGYNLAGNPYPSYVNWNAATKTNLSNTMWYRTMESGGVYKFYTYNTVDGAGIGVPASVTSYIPPMQAFWVQVTGGTGTLGFDNTMRSHQDIAENALKAPAAKNTVQQLVRLQVSNGTNEDEAVVYITPNASNGFDKYDSPKMSNNDPAIPEIYTAIGNNKLVINGMNSITTNTEIPLGFTTGQSNSFSIKASEITNFDSNTRVFLKDKLLGTQQDLTDGSAYTFASDIASTTDRFSVVFKSVEVTTGIDATAGDLTVLIYKNNNNQIAVNYKGDTSSDATVSVYNALGQKLESQKITGSVTVTGKALTSGVYVVTVINGGKSTTRKVILN